MRLPPSPFVLQLAIVFISCFGGVTRGRALSAGRQDSKPSLAAAPEGPFTNHLSPIPGETESRNGMPEDLEETPTDLGRTASLEHEESGLYKRQETFGTGSLREPLATSGTDRLHRRREREAPKPWLPDDEGSGDSSETEWDDEDLFLQQRRAARRGHKGGQTQGRRKNVDWLQLQGVTAHHAGQKSDHNRQQVAAKNELPSQEQGPLNEAPSRRPQHANAAKRRSKKRHRMKATHHDSSSPLPQPQPEPQPEPDRAPSSGGGGRRSQRQHRRQRQKQQRKQQQPEHTTTTAQPPPPPRKFGGGDMSLESRIRALKKIASGAEEGDGTEAQPLEQPAFYSGDSPRWSPHDEWYSDRDQRLWRVLGSGDGGGPLDYADTARTGAAPGPPPPPPPTRPPPLGRSTAATPVNAAAAAHVPQPTQSRHFAYHRVTEAQSAAAASHHQEAFVAVSMVELPGNHSREHLGSGHHQAHQPVSSQNLSTRTASWETPGTTTPAPLFAAPALDSDVISDQWVGGSGGDPWVSSSRSGAGGLLPPPPPTWFRLRHRGRSHARTHARNHFRKGAMEELMNRHREEQWLRRRLGLPPENPHEHFAD